MLSEVWYPAGCFRIVSTPETSARGCAGRIGVCKGVTTPSYSGVEVIGEATNDRALSVRFDDTDEEVWFSPDLDGVR